MSESPERPERARGTVWVVSELYYPEETSTGYYMTKTAEGLAQRFPVRVLCAQPTYSARGSKAPRREVEKGVEIRRVWSTTWSNLRLAGRLANLLTVSSSLFLHCLFRFRRGDLALVVSTPPSLPFAVAAACFLRRARCVVLLHDTYPELLVVSGHASSKSIFVRALIRANRMLYRFAARVVVLGRGMAERAREKLPPEQGSKVRVIRTWADHELVRAAPREGSEFLERLGLGDKFVVQYAGNISPLNDIENLLDAIERLADRPDLHFLFVGRGSRRRRLEEEVERRGLAHVTLLDWIPRSESPEMHRGCDLALVPLIPGMAGMAVPSRLYNALAAGRPILAVTEETSELARIVVEEDAGWVVPPGDPERLAAAVAEASADPVRRRAMGRRARKAAETRFSQRRAIEDWLALFEELRTDNGGARPAPRKRRARTDS